MSSIISIDNLKAGYIFKDQRTKKTVNVEAVDNISLTINAGETIGIAGESGCGKSTLAKLIYGLVHPPLTVVNGSVSYNLGDKKTNIFKLDEERLRRLRWETISYIPQGSMSVLNPTSRIKDTFLDAISAHKSGFSKKEAEELILKQLSSAGLSPEVPDRTLIS
jgi:ABC-type dipeptide/oligopeptide/nickel transport system, ATPase component